MRRRLPAPGHRETTARRRRFAAVVATALWCAAAWLAASGCTEDPPVAPPVLFTGTWDLVAVGTAPMPIVLETFFDGSRRLLVEGQLTVRSRGRIDDSKRTRITRGFGPPLADVSDTTTSPFSATSTALFIRRYALLADLDWVDTGTVNGDVLTLRARYLERQFGAFDDVVLTYRRRR